MDKTLSMLTDSSHQVKTIPSHMDVSGIHRCLFFLALICGLLRLCALSKMTLINLGRCTCLQSGQHKQQFQDQGNSAVLRPAFTGQPLQGVPVYFSLRLPQTHFLFSALQPAKRRSDTFWFIAEGHAQFWTIFEISCFQFWNFMVLFKNVFVLCSLQVYAMCVETFKSGEGLWV